MLSPEFRCAFKQDQVDFLLEKLVFLLNFNGLSKRFFGLRVDSDAGYSGIPL